MNILAHRGFWSNPEEKNTLVSFLKARDNFFGIELDVRDYCGEIVVSHDVLTEKHKTNNVIYFHDLVKQIKETEPYLAVNIKSDGIGNLVKDILDSESYKNYFMFDMSVPETILYSKNNIIYFIRISEFEPLLDNSLVNNSHGLWIDSFYSDWYNEEYIKGLISLNKPICFVSPELHGRDHLKIWSLLKNFDKECNQLILCTDFPEIARDFFLSPKN